MEDTGDDEKPYRARVRYRYEVGGRPHEGTRVVISDGGSTDNTRAVLINSPNNPTGQVYSEESLQNLGRLLRDKSRELGHTIYLISDEPYRKIVFDGVRVPSIFPHYKESIVVTSYSTDI